MSYLPRPDSNLEIHDPKQQLQYVLRHFDPVLIETVDNEGNQFRVTNLGESIVSLKDGREERSTVEPIRYKQHAPRLFVMREDGSGLELLRYPS